MAIFKLVEPTDPILHQRMEEFDFTNPPMNPLDLACDLAETMIHNGGIGLAANQCGLPYRVFVLMGTDVIPCFNPVVVDASQEQVTLEEGCLSYPGLAVKVRRPKKIRVRYTEPNGNVTTRIFDGITARAFLHELSHLNGVCHIDEASQLHREQARTKWKQMQRRRQKGLTQT